MSQSLQSEHKAIHDALAKATQVPGPLGAAARELEAVLGPHFTRENEIALPPLGLLAPLAAGEKPAGMEEALALSEEELLYPAAILVGDVIRARMTQK